MSELNCYVYIEKDDEYWIDPDYRHACIVTYWANDGFSPSDSYRIWFW